MQSVFQVLLGVFSFQKYIIHNSVWRRPLFLLYKIVDDVRLNRELKMYPYCVILKVVKRLPTYINKMVCFKYFAMLQSTVAA